MAQRLQGDKEPEAEHRGLRVSGGGVCGGVWRLDRCECGLRAKSTG